MRKRSRVKEGSVEARGAIWDGHGTNVRLRARSDTRRRCFGMLGDVYAVTARSVLIYGLTR
jgi:hypothetical protein